MSVKISDEKIVVHTLAEFEEADDRWKYGDPARVLELDEYINFTQGRMWHLAAHLLPPEMQQVLIYADGCIYIGYWIMDKNHKAEWHLQDGKKQKSVYRWTNIPCYGHDKGILSLYRKIDNYLCECDYSKSAFETLTKYIEKTREVRGK